MATYTTHVRVPVEDYRADPDTLVASAEHRVRVTLRAATDPDAAVALWWHAVLPGADPSAHPGSGRGETMIAWVPGEDVPAGAAELACRGRAVS